ncbi:hypothetical protein SDIMI_v3c01350 [Spiroplasma diminutum CUAS-1]|uniref:Uncharacterized protein n=1 Tax=Spiroplasma diminutum CUAS-1 TaxID=1276221 RepID=S5LVJ5_9MOLU|nr:hypothetical protein SDIMI_v3c01350 [Spiroplasma diminutum CUAS-1]
MSIPSVEQLYNLINKNAVRSIANLPPIFVLSK